MADSKKPTQAAVTLKTLKRVFSLKKRRGSEAAGTEDTASHTSPTFPDTQKSPTAENGFTFANIRRSLRKKSIHEIFTPKEDTLTTSNVMEKETTKYCDFTYNSLPSTPLSVLEINSLIDKKALKEAYLNILALQNEVECEQKEASSVNLDNKKTDLDLLYNNLRNKLVETIRQLCSMPSCDKELLVLVAGIIEDKEKRQGNVHGMEGWRDVWRVTIRQGVKETLGKMNSTEPKVSLIKEHLELLGKNMVELLERVKGEILNLYPPSFHVFGTYASSCHEFVGEHLKVLLGKVTQLNDYEAMLDFVLNRYHSGMVLGSPSLQSEMKNLKFTLSVDLLEQIKKGYCDCLQKMLHASLGNITKIEQEQVWKIKVTPKRTEDEIYIISEVHTRVFELIRKHSDGWANIDEDLEKMAICKCLDMLKQFAKSFVEEFSKECQPLLSSDLLDCCLWAEYHISYINSFSSLEENIEGYRKKCPEHVAELISELEGVIDHLRQALLGQSANEIKPYLFGLMTKKWLNTETDFNELVNRIETYSGYKKSMRPIPAQSFANDVHYNVAKSYISELLSNKYSCKGKKNEIAAAKIKEQWIELKKLFCEMGSSLDWLHSLGFHISEIIEQEEEKNMKNALTALIENYPDISKKQLSAILYFRDSGLKFERSPAIQFFTERKRKIDNEDKGKTGTHAFFSDIK